MATPDAQDPKLGSDPPKPIADKVQAAGTDAVKEGTHTVDAVIFSYSRPLSLFRLMRTLIHHHNATPLHVGFYSVLILTPTSLYEI